MKVILPRDSATYSDQIPGAKTDGHKNRVLTGKEELFGAERVKRVVSFVVSGTQKTLTGQN